MNMELVTYILSQIFTVIEYGLLGASYLAKSRKAVVILDIGSMLCGIIAFIFLGADAGLAMSVVILLANFYYLWDEHVHTEKERSKLHVRDYIVLAVVLSVILVLSIMTYENPASLLSVLATVLYEISIWQKSTKVYKFLGIPVAMSWMLYNGFEHSIFGVLCEMVMFITSIIGYVREIRAAKKLKMAKRRGKARSNGKISQNKTTKSRQVRTSGTSGVKGRGVKSRSAEVRGTKTRRAKVGSSRAKQTKRATTQKRPKK